MVRIVRFMPILDQPDGLRLPPSEINDNQLIYNEFTWLFNPVQ